MVEGLGGRNFIPSSGFLLDVGALQPNPPLGNENMLLDEHTIGRETNKKRENVQMDSR